MKGENCSLDVTRRVIEACDNDSRLLIENMPWPGFLCTSYDELHDFIEQTGVGFCLDIGHAVSYAFTTDIDYHEHLESLFALNPDYYHLSDTRFEVGINGWNKDSHLPLGVGSTDWRFVKSLLPDDFIGIFETPMDDRQIQSCRIIENINCRLLGQTQFWFPGAEKSASPV